MIGGPCVGARRFIVVVVPGIGPTAERLTRLRGVRHLVLFAEQFDFRGGHTKNVCPARRACNRGRSSDSYLGPPEAGSAPRRPGAPAVA